MLPVHDAEHALFLDELALAADSLGGLEADECFAVPETSRLRESEAKVNAAIDCDEISKRCTTGSSMSSGKRRRTDATFSNRLPVQATLQQKRRPLPTGAVLPLKMNAFAHFVFKKDLI